MPRLRWTLRMLADVVRFGIVNRSPAMSLSMVALLVVGVMVAAAEVAAPFVYTLF